MGKAYTCGRDSQLTFDEYMQLVGGVVGMEPEIVHVPVDVLLSMDSDEIRNSFLSTLARYNTCFSVEAFKADFPDFKWENSGRPAMALRHSPCLTNSGWIWC